MSEEFEKESPVSEFSFEEKEEKENKRFLLQFGGEPSLV